MALQQGAPDLLARLLVVRNPEVRGAAVFALGKLIQVRLSPKGPCELLTSRQCEAVSPPQGTAQFSSEKCPATGVLWQQ